MSGEFQIFCSTMVEGTDEWDWLQARTAHIPGDQSLAVTTMNKTLNRFTHDYGAIYQIVSCDHGDTWSEPKPVPSLGRIETQGYEVAPSDMWNQWHPCSRKVIAVGVSFHFAEGRHEHQLRRKVAYAVMDPHTAEWDPLKTLVLPERDHDGLRLLAPSAGCSQRVDLPDGDVLLPISYLPSATLDENTNVFDYSEPVLLHSIVARCGFDGQSLAYREHGTQHSITADHSRRLAERRGAEFSARGLAEPSLASFDGAFFLTLRSDHSAFVTKGIDGVNFEEVREWTFDDGEILGSYCTQQHWAVIGGKLHLLYCRPRSDNDHIFRHRAPIFIAEIDPLKLQVIRATEREAIPENNAAMGNFGICQISDSECWVTCGDGAQTGLRKGEVNKVMFARIVAP